MKAELESLVSRLRKAPNNAYLTFRAEFSTKADLYGGKDRSAPPNEELSTLWRNVAKLAQQATTPRELAALIEKNQVRLSTPTPDTSLPGKETAT
jgi:hypothetical protein